MESKKRCNKRGYPDRFATDMAFYGQMVANDNRRENRTYWCKQCNAYHFTSNSRGRRRFREKDAG